MNPEMLAMAAEHESAATLAENAGWDTGDLPAIRARLAECRRLADPAPAAPLQLGDPKTVEKQLRTAARHAVEDREVVALARETSERLLIELAAAVRGYMPGWCADLAAEFDTTLGQFREAAATAPQSIDADTEPDELTAYQAALRAGGRLDQLVGIRLHLATATSEHGSTSGWLVACEVPPAAGRDPHSGQLNSGDRVTALRDMLLETQMGDWTTRSSAERWRLMDRVAALRLARSGELEQRADQWPHIRQSVGSVMLNADRERAARAERLAQVGA